MGSVLHTLRIDSFSPVNKLISNLEIRIILFFPRSRILNVYPPANDIYPPKKRKKGGQKLVTLEDVKKNSEIKALIEGAQKQLDGLRIYRT